MKLDNGLPLALGLIGLLVAAGVAKDKLGSRSLDDGGGDNGEAYDCPSCGHGPGVILSKTGNLTHCRCRNCGMDFSVRGQYGFAFPTRSILSADYRRGVRDGLEDERDLEEEP